MALSVSFKHTFIRISILFTALLTLTAARPKDSSFELSPDMVSFLREYLSVKYRGVSFDRFVYVAAKKQRMYLIDGDAVVQSYSISTAKKGIGSKMGSYQTPAGLHRIADKVGDELEACSILKSKQATGQKAEILSEARSSGEDLITSRILHLKGLEDKVNSGEGCDSYERGIFIHGTHEEGLLGVPASKGCVRMANADIIDLFNRVEVGTFVVILNN